MSGVLQKLWSESERSLGIPNYFSGEIERLDYKTLVDWLGDPQANITRLERLVRILSNGGILILPQVFSDLEIETIKSNVIDFWGTEDASFHRVIEGCPNYHRVIDESVAKNYSFYALKHATYCQPWCEDITGMRPQLLDVWRNLKFFMGLKRTQFEGNTPNDGVVDRIQVVLYPKGSGVLEPHTDPGHNQRLVISTYMATRGIDYEKGGFYVIDYNNARVDVEKYVKKGDVALMHTQIYHGVEAIDPDFVSDSLGEYPTEGRWWLSLFSNDSDTLKERKTSKGYGQKF